MSSDDESSDSSNDFLVPAEKIDLDNSFFTQDAQSKINKKTHQQQNIKNEVNKSDDTDSSDDDFIEDKHIDSSALLAEVMKNLEKINSTSLNEQSNKSVETSLKHNKKNPNELTNEINDLLLKGESDLGSKFVNSDDEKNNDDDEKKNEYSIPKEGVNITLPGTEMIFNRRKRGGGINLEEQLIKKLNKRLRLNQLYVHKVGLLCWLAHGFHINKQINDPELLSMLLSLIPTNSYPNGRVDLKYIEQFTKWFKGLIKIEFNKDTEPVTKDILLKRVKDKKVHNYRELILVFISALRAIGINCRLVISLCPPPMKLKRDQLFQSKKRDSVDEKNSSNHKNDTEDVKPSTSSQNKGKKGEKMKNHTVDKIVPENSNEAINSAKIDAKKRAVELLRSKSTVDSGKTLKNGKKSSETKNDEIKSPSRKMRLRSSKIPETSISHDSDDEEKEKKIKKDNSKTEEKNVKSIKEKFAKKNTTKKLLSHNKKNVKVEKKSESDDDDYDDDDDDDYNSSSENSELENFKKKRKLGKPKVKKLTKKKRESIDRKVLSSDDGNDEEEEKIDVRDARYLWVEVYVESEESWISVSVPDNKIHCVSDIYKKLPTPVLYIVAWNSVGTIKDVTRRYCPHWLTVTRKQRIEENWWSDTLLPWNEKTTALSKAEDEMLLQMEMEQPLPDSIGKYKGHPLYVLSRHLLKYEALYPPDCVPLGYLKNNEAVYSRHCVHTLRSRETWLKEARVVKPSQEPYKIVKAMPKYDKFTGQIIKDQPLELFGKWQTTQYDPPVTKDGIVPRNEYGNVDLFKQCMLPKGTVHIDLPALCRIAKKLNIDCVPAVVGFNFGCRGAMPATQGYVVCEEYEDTLRKAWETEQIESAKRAREKRDKRIWGNWRKLIRGLMIKERLAAKYEISNDEEDGNEPPCVPPAKRASKNDKRPVKKKKLS